MRVGKTARRRRGDRLGWASFVRGALGGGGWRGWRGGWFLMGVRDRSTNAAPSSCVATGDGRWRLGGTGGAGEAEATPGGDLKMGPDAATTCDWSLCRLAEAFVFPRLLERPASVRRSLCLCSVLPGDGCDNTPARRPLLSASTPVGRRLPDCTSQPLVHPPTMTADAHWPGELLLTAPTMPFTNLRHQADRHLRNIRPCWLHHLPSLTSATSAEPHHVNTKTSVAMKMRSVCAKRHPRQKKNTTRTGHVSS